MRKIIIFILLVAIAGFAGYSFIQKDPVLKAKVDQKKFQADTAILATKVIKAQSPQEVKTIIAENQDVIADLTQKGYIKEQDVAAFQKKLDEMEARGEPFNRVKILETYAKDKLAPDKYKQVEEVLSKPELSTADLYKLATIVKGP